MLRARGGSGGHLLRGQINKDSMTIAAAEAMIADALHRTVRLTNEVCMILPVFNAGCWSNRAC